MTERTNIASGSAWEPLRGYSRAVEVGGHLFISGTTASDAQGNIVGVGNPYEQACYVFGKIRRVVQKAGYTMEDVVRTRLFITDMSHWEVYARAHREYFEKIRPASSIVQVSKLRDPRILLEVEADAIKGCHLAESYDLDE